MPAHDTQTRVPDDFIPEVRLLATDDAGDHRECVYVMTNADHLGCGGDIHLHHLHDAMGAITGNWAHCGKCGEDMTPGSKAGDGRDGRPCRAEESYDGTATPCSTSGDLSWPGV